MNELDRSGLHPGVRLLTALLPIALTLGCAGAPRPRPVDSRVEWLKGRVGVPQPAGGVEDAAVFAPLKEALSGVRIVLLGEAGHGDGSTLEAKVRLVRALREELGFDVLVLEGGLVEGEMTEHRRREGRDLDTWRDLLPLAYLEAAPLARLRADVVDATRGSLPMHVAGFDASIGEAGAAWLADSLPAELERIGVGAEEIEAARALRPWLGILGRDAYFAGEPLPAVAEREAILGRIDRWIDAFEATAARDDEVARLWAQLLRNVRAAAEHAWRLAEWDPAVRFAAGASHVPPAIQNVRFQQMGDNLLWLARERYAGHKIVVWSTTVLLARHLERLVTGEADVLERFAQFHTPGEIVAEAMGESSYVLAFTAFEGRIGRALPGRVPSPLLAPTPGSLEDLFGRTGLAAGFVDLRAVAAGGEWLRRPLIARPISHKELLGRWPEHVDGLVFLRTMVPASEIGATITP